MILGTTGKLDFFEVQAMMSTYPREKLNRLVMGPVIRRTPSRTVPSYSMIYICKELDVILGNTFLTGNKAVLNCKRHTVSLTRDGKLYQLRAATPAAEPDRSAEFEEVHDDRQFLSCAQASTALSGSIDALRHKYADIFDPPAGLPLDRGIEHVIPLIPDAQAAPQRMYRLAPAELTEVKAQVTDSAGERPD